MAYIEPAPIKDKENPFESMMSRFHIAAQHLGLDDEVYNVLKSPEMTRYVGYTSLVGLILSIPLTEIHIRRIFDKDGNRKNH